MFSWPRLALRGEDGSRKYVNLQQVQVFSPFVHRLFKEMFSIQEMVNRPQWITASEADTDSRLSVPGWSWVLNGPSLTMEVNIYPNKCQYPGSETVWYKNVRQMDFYSPLIPPGGFKAEPNGERSLRGVVRGKAGHCNFKLNVLEPGQGVMQKWKVFLCWWWG